MERKNTLKLSAAAGIILASGALMPQAYAADSTARSAMLTINNLPCKSITNNVCNIDQTYDSLSKTCKASIAPSGLIASERVLFRDRSDNKRLKSMFMYGFKLENTNSYNGTDVYGMKVQVTGRPGGKRFDVTRNENDGLLVELLDENKGVDLSYYGVNGATGRLGLLTSSDGLTYNKNCKREMSGNKTGVSVNAIQNGKIGSCVSADLKDTSASNDDAGADVVTWSSESIPLPPGNYLITASATLKNMYNDDDELMVLASRRIHVNNNKTCEKITPPPADDIVEEPDPVDFGTDPFPPSDLDNSDTFGDSGLNL